MKDLFQRIFLSSDPDNDDIKELVYDCLYLPWLKGEFDIAPVDIWRRAMGNAIVQATQQTATKTSIDTYINFKQLALSKDGVSHCLYFLNAAYSD